MFKLILVCSVIIGLSLFFLCIKIIFKKNGRFPNTHVSGNKAMRQRGINCIQSQEFEMRTTSPNAVKEHTK
jgi:hypothetical protein